jgi:hypothetical protein
MIMLGKMFTNRNGMVNLSWSNGWRKAEFEIQKYIKSIGQKNIISMYHHFERDKKFTLVLERGLCSLTELMDHYTFNQDSAYMPRTKNSSWRTVLKAENWVRCSS